MSAIFREYRKNCWERCLAGAAGLLLVVLVVLLCGCQTTETVTLGKGVTGVTFMVGSNDIGESCKVIGVEPLVETEEIRAVYNVFCGRWTEPSARIFRTAQPAGAQELLSQGWWRERLNDFANCAPPEPTLILGDVPAVSMDCGLRVGGWPYPALAAELGDSTYVAESIPAALQVTERAIGVLSGKMSPAQARKVGKMARQISELNIRLAAARYSVGELNTFRNLLRLGQSYNFLGQYSEAEQTYRQALELQRKIMPDRKDGLSYLYMHIGLELSNQGHFNAADAMFETAEQLLIYSMEPTYETTLMSYRALHLANQRQSEAALTMAQQATAKRREIAEQYGVELPDVTGAAIPETKAGLAPAKDLLVGSTATAVGDIVQSRYLEAAMLKTAGKTEKAEKALSEALSIFQTNPGIPAHWYHEILLLQAEIAEQRGEFGLAAKLLQESLLSRQNLYRGTRTEAMSYIALGRVYTAQGHARPAYEAFGAGFAIIKELGENIPVDKALPYLRLGLEISAKDPERQQEILQKLFENGQLASGALVAQLMRQTAARLATGDRRVSGIIRELQDARNKRDELQETFDIAQSDPTVLAVRLTGLERQLENSKKRVVELERAVQIAEPRYNQLIEAPVVTPDVFDLLQPGEALVQILVGSTGSFGFFVTNGSISAYEIDLTAGQANEFVAALRRPMEEFDPKTGLPLPFPVAEAYLLYEKLFTPVKKQLTGAAHIITVPSGPLLSLPFNVLVLKPSPQIKGYDYSEVDWMGGRFALTLAPTVQSFVNLRKTVSASSASLPFIGFGDFVPIGADLAPALETFGKSERCLNTATNIAALKPLHETANELRAVAELLGSSEDSLVLGKAFSKSRVKNTNLNKYRIVYFATHGLLPHQLECLQEPSLVVSHVAGEGDDVLLTSSDILDLKLDADLVVLSACNTGGPGGTKGEALSGLARVFFFAGARSMLVSHWEIPSAPTVKLMQDTFAEAVDKNLPMAKALLGSQQAMIAFPPWSHPKAWAGFSIVGDGSHRLTPPTSNTPKVAVGGQ